jgi:hypothetical protein
MTPAQKSKHLRVISLLCVLLIAFTGTVQAIHVHSDNAKLPAHDCSLCSVAHAGVIGGNVYQLAPVFVGAYTALAPEYSSQSSEPLFSLHIRPPPAN